jgi:hypothetical protein
MSLVCLLILSSFSSVAAWQPQSVYSETIGLKNGDIESIPIELIPEYPQFGFWILTHEYPVPSEWVHELAAAGVECWSFLPSSAFHCELNGHTPSQLAKMEVSGMIQMPPSSKLHPDLLPSLKGEMESWFMTEGMGVVNLVLSGDDLPEGIEAISKGKKNEKLEIKGISKQVVGQVAAKIRSLRKPEPYKGKGIRYKDEYVRSKQGKTVGGGD